LLLYLVPQASDVHLPGEILGGFLFFVIVGAYPFFSAFVTFRSPRKTVLLACGVIFNIPIALIGLFYYGLYDKAYWLGELPRVISAFCGSFIVAWMIFLVARLSVRIKPAPSQELSNNKSIADAPSLGHQCLGSRFAAWQHHEV
jgi:branched-subunit amino acid ABC-type transport system permease component